MLPLGRVPWRLKCWRLFPSSICWWFPSVAAGCSLAWEQRPGRSNPTLVWSALKLSYILRCMRCWVVNKCRAKAIRWPRALRFRCQAILPQKSLNSWWTKLSWLPRHNWKLRLACCCKLKRRLSKAPARLGWLPSWPIKNALWVGMLALYCVAEISTHACSPMCC